MSRTPISSRRPRHGGTFRPKVEALEDRLAPGSLAGTFELPPGDLANHAAQEAKVAQQEDKGADQLAFLAGLQAGPGISFLAPVAGQQQTEIVTTNPVLDFVDRSVVVGSSTLLRTEQGVGVFLEASGLPEGVYTAWFALFNIPGAMTPSAAGWRTGRLVGPSGTLRIAAGLREGEVLTGHPVFPSGPLEDAMQPEIHIVIRYHGPVVPARLLAQLTMFEPTDARNFLISMHPVP